MSKKTSPSKQKKKTKLKIVKDQDPYIGFEPMGEMQTIPARSSKQDFPLGKLPVR